MQFDFEVQKSIDLISNILLDLGGEQVLDNQFISLGELTSNGYADLVFRNPHGNSIPINIRCSRYDVQIDLDETPEVFEWPIILIETKSVDFTARIRQLLTGCILVEKRGNGYKAFSVFNPSGHFLFRTPIISSFYYFTRPSFHLFLPYFVASSRRLET